MNEAPSPDMDLPSENSPHSRGRNKLFLSALALLIATVLYYARFAQVRDSNHLFLGLAILILALVPALHWAKNRDSQIPVFAIMALTTLNTYALPLLNGHQELQRYSVDTITRAALCVLLFQCLTILAYRMLRFEPGRGDFYEQPIIDDRSRPWILAGLFLATLYTLLSTYSSVIPPQAASLLRAIFSGLGMICTFVTLRDWGKDQLSLGARVVAAGLIGLQLILLFSTLMMVTGISLICLALIGYISGAQRIPYLFIILLIPLVAVLHNGKAQMRTKYWHANLSSTAEQLKLSDLPQFYSKWIQAGLSEQSSGEHTRNEQLTARLLERSSLFHMLCLVIHYTPDRQPYLQGETYRDIPAQFVPRFLWAKKPGAHASTTRLSVYYGLQREEDTEKTTIGFGLLPEAYANFGMSGIAALAVFFATLFKWIEMRSAQSPLLSLAGILLITMTAWSFQTEFPLSMWLSSLAQACFVLLLIPMLFRKLRG